MLEARTVRGSAGTNPTNKSDANTSEIRRAIEILFEAGNVVELRAFKDRRTISGYFDDHEDLAEQAERLEGRGFAVYVTLNPVEPALLARAHNRVRHYPKATTSDTDILYRRWLPLDFDTVRPADVSSTDEEKKAALQRAREVRNYLSEQGWPEPILADSGNGYHLLYRVDLLNNRESLELVKGALEAPRASGRRSGPSPACSCARSSSRRVRPTSRSRLWRYGGGSSPRRGRRALWEASHPTT